MADQERMSKSDGGSILNAVSKRGIQRGRGRGRGRGRSAPQRGNNAPSTSVVRVVKKKKPQNTNEDDNKEQPANLEAMKAIQERTLDYRNVVTIQPAKYIFEEDEMTKEKEKDDKKDEHPEQREEGEQQLPDIFAELESFPEYLERIRTMSIASNSCDEFMKNYRVPREASNLFLPITKFDIDLMLQSKFSQDNSSSSCPRSIFDFIHSSNLKKIAIVGTCFLNSERSHLLQRFKLQFSNNILEELGGQLKDVTHLAFDAVALTYDEAVLLAPKLPHLQELTLIGWAASEQPTASIRLSNIEPFQQISRIRLDRVMFHERFLSILLRKLDKICVVTIISNHEEGPYQHIGARPKAFLHKLEESFPNIKFETEPRNQSYTMSQEQHDVVARLTAEFGTEVRTGSYVPPALRSQGLAKTQAGLGDLSLNSEMSFPSLDAVLDVPTKSTKSVPKNGSISEYSEYESKEKVASVSSAQGTATSGAYIPPSKRTTNRRPPDSHLSSRPNFAWRSASSPVKGTPREWR